MQSALSQADLLTFTHESGRYDEGGDAGFLTSADQGGRQRLTWDYDLAGQLRSERYSADGATLTSTVEYAYDASGNRTALKLDGQVFTSYEYDDASRLTWLRRGAAAFGFDYDAAHHRTALSYPSGVHTSFTYDDLSRVKLIEAVAPTTVTVLASAGYTHDDVGNRLTKTLLEHAETYHYDALDRLRRVERGAATTESYTYDRELPDTSGNNGFVPFKDDCHTYLGHCLASRGLKDPDTPGGRFGCRTCPNPDFTEYYRRGGR